MIDPRCLRRSNPSPRRPKALRGRSNRVRNLPARMAPTRLRLSSMRTELAPPAPRRSNPNPRGRRASLKPRSRRPKTPESRSNRILSFQRPMLPTPRPLRLRLRRKDLSPLRPSLEATDSDAPAVETAPPDLAERSAASELQPSPPERTAAIYVLRHPAPAASSNIVPIRPGALDALARETAPSFPAESVELSRSERDAFREIARALVGRAPASRDDSSDERAGADTRREVRDRYERRAADGPARRCWGGARRRRR